MAEITVTLTDPDRVKVMKALGKHWTPKLADGTPNPQTRDEMAHARHIAWLQDETLEHERTTGRNAAFANLPLVARVPMA